MTAQPVIKKLLRQMVDATIARRPLEYFEVTQAELVALMCHPSYSHGPPEPKPPVKSRSTWSGGLFGNSGSTVEYDNHAPEYLEARRRWQYEMQQHKEPEIFGLPLRMTS